MKLAYSSPFCLTFFFNVASSTFTLPDLPSPGLKPITPKIKIKRKRYVNVKQTCGPLNPQAKLGLQGPAFIQSELWQSIMVYFVYTWALSWEELVASGAQGLLQENDTCDIV